MRIKFLIVTCLIHSSAFAEIDIEKFTEIKTIFRQKIINSRSLINKSLILNNDRAEDFVDYPNKMIRNLEQMEKLNLVAKSVSVSPWSDSYWPLYAGSIAYRYNDSKNNFKNWNDFKKYFENNSTDELIKDRKFEMMSPAEKYDYVLDIQGDNLTKYAWSQGEEYNQQFSKVETWMGSCHGWSIASIMLPNPIRKVPVKSPRDENVVFNPSDIKALGTFLWAQTNFPTKFIGGRCDQKNPKLDSLGRPVEVDCLDTNPGTWHMAIVNQIGLFDRSFVMDATYNYEVWNQPVYGYSYTYRNILNNKKVKNLSEAIIDVSSYPNDQRKSVRSLGTKYVVAVSMSVKYVSETEPSRSENQIPAFTEVVYEYELELDSNKNIIGGEWISKAHPDFLWTADINAFPRTYGDNNKVDLANISSLVKNSAVVNAKKGIPLGSFVRELFVQSSKK